MLAPQNQPVVACPRRRTHGAMQSKADAEAAAALMFPGEQDRDERGGGAFETVIVGCLNGWKRINRR